MILITGREIGLIVSALYRAEQWERELDDKMNAPETRRTARNLANRYAKLAASIQQRRLKKRSAAVPPSPPRQET